MRGHGFSSGAEQGGGGRTQGFGFGGWLVGWVFLVVVVVVSLIKGFLRGGMRTVPYRCRGRNDGIAFGSCLPKRLIPAPCGGGGALLGHQAAFICGGGGGVCFGVLSVLLL